MKLAKSIVLIRKAAVENPDFNNREDFIEALDELDDFLKWLGYSRDNLD